MRVLFQATTAAFFTDWLVIDGFESDGEYNVVEPAHPDRLIPSSRLAMAPDSMTGLYGRRKRIDKTSL
jgi:hypothetical protein